MKWLEKYQSIISTVLFLAAVTGWLVDSMVTKRVMKAQVEENAENIEWIVQALLEDKEFKGKIIMYMEMDAKNHSNEENN